MVREVDWSKWRRTRLGYVRIPPPTCPRGHRWTELGPGRPSERFVTCSCTPDRHHVLWVCPTCGMYCAEGCVDVTQWHGHTVPHSIWADRRGAV